MLRNWLKPRRQQRSPSSRERRHAFRPILEVFEDRCLLSTLTVLNANDAGPDSLRGCIASAASGDTIVFDPTLTGQTITLSSGALAITKSLDIEGLGAANLTISGNAASRVFDISSGVTLFLAELTMTDGLADQGGGIQNAGNLTVTHCILSNNEALGDSSSSGVGGGLFNEPGALLTLIQSTFSNNQAVGSSLGLGFGGGLMNLGVASIAGGTFTGNQAIGGATSFAGEGGGISNQSSATLTVSGSTFTGNLALDGLSTVALGGGIDLETNGSLTLSNSTFTGNEAESLSTSLSFSGAWGGAIDSGTASPITSVDTLSVVNCGFTGNLATGFDFGNSGAITVVLTQTTITNSTFTNNQAKGFGPGGSAIAGAIFNVDFGSIGTTITGSTFTGNQAIATAGADGVNTFSYTSGGAIDNEGPVHNPGTLSVANCVFTGNQAVGAGGNLGPLGQTGEALGGAISDEEGAILTLTNSMLIGNQALGGSGGTAANGALGQGGGIDIFLESTATLSGCTLSGNLAQGGAGVGGHGGDGQGGGIAVGNIPAGFGNTDTCSLTLTGGTVTGNLALGGAGGAGAKGGDGLGGGILIGLLGAPSVSSLTVTGTLITGNQAVGGIGGLGGNGGNGLGGGLFATSGTTCLEQVSILGNLALGGGAGSGGNAGQGVGGGLYIDPLATAGAEDSNIFGNLASTSNDDIFGVLNPYC
jgi:hypothetical protein